MMELPPDIPRVYTALAEWLSCLVLICVINRNGNKGKLAIAALCALAAQMAVFILTEGLSIMFWLPSMMGAVALMFLFVKTAGDVNNKDCIFHVARAFIMAEFAASLEWQIHFWLWPGGKFSAGGAEKAVVFLPLLLLVLVYAVVFVLYYFIEKHTFNPDKKLHITTKELVSAIVLAATAFGLSNLSFVTVATPFSGIAEREIMNIRTVIDLGGLAILYAHYLLCLERRAARELDAMGSVLRTQLAQYQAYKESEEMINRKHHDLKHQIAIWRTESDAARREAFLDKMEQEIRVFEAQNKTGNAILDTILTSKSMYCANHSITMTCVANGELLNFMEVMDICALFGNALDNAIESVEKIGDKARRLIHLTVARQKGFLIIKVENYFEGEIDLCGGLPATTKDDTENHGYGLKSIRHVAYKYGGTLSVAASENWFKLNLLIPLKSGG